VVPGAVLGRAKDPALKRARRALLALSILVVCFFAVPLPPRRGSVRLAAPVQGEGPLRAGAAQVPIALGDHPVLAGYSGRRRATGVAAPVYARALVLEVGGARATIATVDTLLIPPGLTVPGCALLAATHTHSGPGGLWDSLAAGLAGTGRFDEAQRRAVQAALDEAVRRAAEALQPAQVAWSREEWNDGPAQARSEGPIDTSLVALRVTGADGPIATMVNYAMHPTSSPRDQLSPDWPGAAAARFHEPLLVLQGAVGNATFDRSLGTDALGAKVAARAQRMLAPLAPLPLSTLACAQREVELPPPEASRSVPWPLRRAMSNLLAVAFAPAAVETTLSIGGLTLLGVPGEPVGELGLRARPRVLVSLANGYVGYVETEARWAAGQGESARTDFGPSLARALGL
jgi:hypothetical protein